jgi:septum formation protein
MTIVLASASPRRAELLAAAGYSFVVRAMDVDERVRLGERPDEYVCRLASVKSAAAHDPSAAGSVTLGADTAVVVDGTILGKPVDDAEAEAMLRLLSGREHEVLTGISLRMGARELVRVERTVVQFTPLGNQDIAWYVQSGEGRDKAGGYAIQGLGSRFIPRIDGSYSNVVGLPVAAVAAFIRALTESADRLASAG